MTPELFWLVLTAILAGSLWIPFVALSATGSNARYATFDRIPQITAMTDMTQRAWRAHLNLLEQFLPFAVLVLVAQGMGVSTPVTAATACAFFWIRVLHAAGYITGIAKMPLRPLLHLAGWACLLTFAVVLLTA
ncbi:putative relative of glutathione S-transferase, MAPEG superfamily [Marinibacterium anthonyi]|nr:putative relative of glutathione S-transferase, MAPEG superfamily [Marinibacterium anthonyi]